MMTVIKVLLILSFLLLAGEVYFFCIKCGLLNKGESLFFALFICLAWVNILVFVLALLSVYSLPLLAALMWFTDLVSGAVGLKKRLFTPDELKNLPIKPAFIGVFFVLVFLLNACFPTWYLWGRRDPALYLINGIHIAETGSMKFENNELYDQNYEELKDIVTPVYRGIYSDFESGASASPSAIHSQFLHFFSCLLAVGYSLGGLGCLVRVPALLGAFCVAAVYFFTKSVFTKRAAIFAAVMVALNPAQIWSARITQSEILFQLWFIVGCYLFALGWKNKNTILFFLSGFAFSILSFIRIDAYITGIGITAVACYYGLFYREQRVHMHWLVGGYTVPSVLAFVYSKEYSPAYFDDLWQSGILSSVVFFVLALLVLYIIISLFFKSPKPGKHNIRLSVNNPFATLADSRVFRFTVYVALLIIFLLLYFVRPHFQKGLSYDDDFNCRSMVEFCWYVSIIAIPLFIFGLVRVMGDRKRRQASLIFLAIGAINLVAYIYKPSIAPDHIWASRRWVSVDFPFVQILAAYGIDRILCGLKKPHPWMKYIPHAICGIISCFMIYQSRLFLFSPMLSEMPKEYEQVAEQLDDDVLYLGSQSHFSSILRFVYHKNIFVIDPSCEDAIEAYFAENSEPLYYLGDVPLEGNFNSEVLFSGCLEGTYVVQQQKAYVESLGTTGCNVQLYRLSPLS